MQPKPFNFRRCLTAPPTPAPRGLVLPYGTTGVGKTSLLANLDASSAVLLDLESDPLPPDRGGERRGACAGGE